MKVWEKYLLSFSLIVWVVCNNFWVIAGVPVYYFGVAQLIFVSSLIIHNQPKISAFQDFISGVFLFLAFNNILDELFFDPQAFEINEYIMVGAYILYLAWRIFKK